MNTHPRIHSLRNVHDIKRLRQQGFTLVEILLVLGIIAVLAIAAFVIYPKVQAAAQARTVSSNITTIASGVKSLFASTAQYEVGGAAGDFTSTIVLAKVAPQNMIDSGANTLHSVFDPTPASVTVGTSSTYGSADGTIPAGSSLFDIQYTAVPSAICVKLATGVGANFENVLVGGTTVYTTAAPFQLDPGTAATLCSATATVTMDFVAK